jgi:hypothetical protein
MNPRTVPGKARRMWATWRSEYAGRTDRNHGTRSGCLFSELRCDIGTSCIQSWSYVHMLARFGCVESLIGLWRWNIQTYNHIMCSLYPSFTDQRCLM